jgi:hypothetical protein
MGQPMVEDQIYLSEMLLREYGTWRVTEDKDVAVRKGLVTGSIAIITILYRAK